jgi:hypothetical protein
VNSKLTNRMVNTHLISMVDLFTHAPGFGSFHNSIPQILSRVSNWKTHEGCDQRSTCPCKWMIEIYSSLRAFKSSRPKQTYTSSFLLEYQIYGLQDLLTCGSSCQWLGFIPGFENFGSSTHFSPSHFQSFNSRTFKLHC